MSVHARLAAPDPCWTGRADVVVVGSGVAGLTAALRLRSVGSVLVLTKDVLAGGSTQWAQGGVAAALGPGDSPEQHLRDTLEAGAGLGEEEAVRVLVTEGADAVRELAGLGAVFDLTETGTVALTREGGHHRDRIAHAGGDATGAEIQRALMAAVLAAPDIEVVEHAQVLDVLPGSDGGVAGVTVHVSGAGRRSGVGEVRCRALVLGSGGLGQAYAATTNPPVVTGDGMALALRAGAVLRDLEFVQFHPTVLWLGAGSRGQQPLVSEAVRGEGAVLVDDTGSRFMADQHELADLAPRDVVAKAVTRRMTATGAQHVWLDGRGLGAATWRRRFPTVLATCRAHGIDPVTDLVPVLPAAHYVSGGVATDLHGRSTVPGLYACGEVACTGVHGANRLASNSLLEGLVFARRVAAHLSGALPPWQEPATDHRGVGLVAGSVRGDLQRLMTEQAGVLRTRAGLAAGAAALSRIGRTPAQPACVASWETTNLHAVSSALVAAAQARHETRGSHWREDFPHRDDAWAGHLDLTLVDGGLHVSRASGPGTGQAEGQGTGRADGPGAGQADGRADGPAARLLAGAAR